MTRTIVYNVSFVYESEIDPDVGFYEELVREEIEDYVHRDVVIDFSSIQFSDLSPCKYTIRLSYNGEIEVEWSRFIDDQYIVDQIMESVNDNLKIEVEYRDPSVDLEWIIL